MPLFQAPVISVTNGVLTMAAGWDVWTAGYTLRKVGFGVAGISVVEVWLNFTRTGAAITVNATTGGVGDTLIATIPDGYWPKQAIPCVIQCLGKVPGVGKIDLDGGLALQDWDPAGTIATGDTFRMGGTYLVTG